MSITVCSRWGWKISNTEAGLARGSFPIIGLIPASTVELFDFSQQAVLASGATVVTGWGRCELSWAILDDRQMYALSRFVAEARANHGGVLYMTVPAGDGKAPTNELVDLSGFVNEIEARQAADYALALRGGYTENVVIELQNVNIINRPSVYS